MLEDIESGPLHRLDVSVPLYCSVTDINYLLNSLTVICYYVRPQCDRSRDQEWVPRGGIREDRIRLHLDGMFNVENPQLANCYER